MGKIGRGYVAENRKRLWDFQARKGERPALSQADPGDPSELGCF